jgi:fructan beta-fructosidase
MKQKKLFLLVCAVVCVVVQLNAGEISFKIKKKYLNLPVSHQVDRAVMTFEIDGRTERSFEIRLAPGLADYWVFCDVSAFRGQKLKIIYKGEPGGLKKIYQADEIAGHEDLYKEVNRPQLHFTPKRG